jgi:hypothetical protein
MQILGLQLRSPCVVMHGTGERRTSNIWHRMCRSMMLWPTSSLPAWPCLRTASTLCLLVGQLFNASSAWTSAALERSIHLWRRQWRSCCRRLRAQLLLRHVIRRSCGVHQFVWLDGCSRSPNSCAVLPHQGCTSDSPAGKADHVRVQCAKVSAP